MKKFFLRHFPRSAALPREKLYAAAAVGMFSLIWPLPWLLIHGTTAMQIISGGILPALIGIAAMIWCIRKNIFHVLRIKKSGLKTLVIAAAAVLLIAPASGAATEAWKYLLTLLDIPFEENQHLLELAKTLNGGTFFLLFLMVTIPVPIAEEILFRRVIYELFLPAGGGAAFLFTALLFAAAHFFLAGLPGLFIIGAALQLLFIMTGNLSVPILAHALFNAGTMLAVLFVSHL